MPDPQHQYFDTETLKAYIQGEAKGYKVITHRHLKDYEGMVLCITIRFDTLKESYQLDLQWECLGLDLFGDALWESYIYEFDSPDKLLDYLLEKYNISVTDSLYSINLIVASSPIPSIMNIKKRSSKRRGKDLKKILKKEFF